MTLAPLLLVASGLFAIGLFGLLARRHAIGVLLSIELMFNAVNVAFVAVGRYQPAPPGGPFNLGGQVFALFVITVAAAEIGIGLAIVILIYRNRETVNVDEINLLKW